MILGRLQVREKLNLLVVIPLVFQFTPENLTDRIAAGIKAWPALALAIATGLAIVAIELVAPAGTAPFIYFQF